MTPENSPHLDLEITYDNIKKWYLLGLSESNIVSLLRLMVRSDLSSKRVFVRDLSERHLRDFFCRFVDGWTMDSFGNKFHHLNCKLHDDVNGEPAVLEADGKTKRYQDGWRNDGPNGEPAVVYPDGSLLRWFKGYLHDGPNGEPAIVWSNGAVERYRNGLRNDGVNGEPAIVYPDGTVEYYEDGVRQYKAQPINNKRRQ
jgi:hypothetical protein